MVDHNTFFTDVCLADEDGPLDKPTKERLTHNMDYLVRNIDTDSILQPLCQNRVITIEKKDDIMAENTPARRADMLIDVIMRGSRLMFKRFIETLEKSNQCEVLKIIMGPQKHEGKYWGNRAQNRVPGICIFCYIIYLYVKMRKE